jgi:hypothetical protein
MWPWASPTIAASAWTALAMVASVRSIDVLLTALLSFRSMGSLLKGISLAPTPWRDPPRQARCTQYDYAQLRDICSSTIREQTAAETRLHRIGLIVREAGMFPAMATSVRKYPDHNGRILDQQTVPITERNSSA